jgi:hypothetical protein
VKFEGNSLSSPFRTQVALKNVRVANPIQERVGQDRLAEIRNGKFHSAGGGNSVGNNLASAAVAAVSGSELVI